jgi:hypothetical protein
MKNQASKLKTVDKAIVVTRDIFYDTPDTNKLLINAALKTLRALINLKHQMKTK